MDIINEMIGGHTIIDEPYNCLLSPSIKCDDSIDYLKYSSKILSTDDDYEKYREKYNRDLQIDPQHNYLIELPNKHCNVKKDQVDECSNLTSNLTINNKNQIHNIITEESYSLEKYIEKPELLQDFITSEPNFFKILLYEFKNLFEGLKFLYDKNIVHHNINPKNIIFNQKTKKMKFINFGKSADKKQLIESLNKPSAVTYPLQIYYPFICFFINHRNYNSYKKLNDEEKKDFIIFLKDFFFGNTNETKSKKDNQASSILIHQLTHLDTVDEFKKYKLYIKKNYEPNFFNFTLHSFQTNYLKPGQSRSFFLRKIIPTIDAYGLVLTALHFFESIKKKYPNHNIDIPICLTHFIYSSIIYRSRLEPDKVFSRYKDDYDSILEKMKKKHQPIAVKRTSKNISQYKLMPQHLSKYHGLINKNYINHNGKLMRAFKYDEIFKNLDKLSSHNHSLIQKLIDDDTNKYTLNILIDKEAYYKVKYNIYCQDGKEINPYEKKCVDKCPPDHIRNFNDQKFSCTKKNKKKQNKKSQNKSKKNKKCPSGFVRNPFTKACTRKCPPGYIRNLKFNCVAEKDVL
jgi:serine/threonine protein kinase